MVKYHYALDGAAAIIEIAEDQKEKAILLELLKELLKDTIGTLEINKNNITPLKGFCERVFELRKPRDYRIFYVLRGEEMIILDVIKKKKNYLEKRHNNLIKKRLKEI